MFVEGNRGGEKWTPVEREEHHPVMDEGCNEKRGDPLVPQEGLSPEGAEDGLERRFCSPWPVSYPQREGGRQEPPRELLSYDY